MENRGNHLVKGAGIRSGPTYTETGLKYDYYQKNTTTIWPGDT